MLESIGHKFNNKNMSTTKKIILILVIVSLGFFTYQVLLKSGSEEQVFCTMEALQCPDGSYVGRSGPNCEFLQCPNQSSFVGTLRQTSERFELVMQAPINNNSVEVSYVLPLEVRVTNVLGNFVGKRVEVFGSFTTGNTLKVDRLEEFEGGDVLVGKVSLGKTVYINGVNITLNKIVEDSRCPIDAICVWAGNLTANVTLQSDTDKETVNIVSGSKEKNFDMFRITLEEVYPSVKSNVSIDEKDYLLVFKVRQNN